MREVTREEAKTIKGGFGDWKFNCPYCGFSATGTTECTAVRAVQRHVRAWHIPTYPVTTCP